MIATLNFDVKLHDLEHTYIAEHDVHLMTPLKPSRVMVDDFFKFLDELYPQIGEHGNIRIIIDYRGGLPPLSYTIRKGISWSGSSSIHPNVALGLLVKPDALTQIFGTLMSSLQWGHLRSRFFSGDDAMEKATEWCKTAHKK